MTNKIFENVLRLNSKYSKASKKNRLIGKCYYGKKYKDVVDIYLFIYLLLTVNQIPKF